MSKDLYAKCNDYMTQPLNHFFSEIKDKNRGKQAANITALPVVVHRMAANILSHERLHIWIVKGH